MNSDKKGKPLYVILVIHNYVHVKRHILISQLVNRGSLDLTAKQPVLIQIMVIGVRKYVNVPRTSVTCLRVANKVCTYITKVLKILIFSL